MAKNENCVVTDTSVCKWLNKDCKDCYINKMKHDDDRQDALTGFEVLLSMLPDDFDSLGGEKCVFCKKDPKPRAGYALIDLGNKDPESKRGMFFGIGKKVRQRIGSMVPMSLSICKDCRRTFRLYEGIKWLSVVAFLALAIILVSIPSTSISVSETTSMMPYFIVIGGAVVGYFVGKLITMRFIRAKAKQTYVNIFDIPVCGQMQERGWFLIQDTGEITRYIFSKKPMIRKTAGLKQVADKKEEFSQTSFLEH